ncbi:MAG TPA: hypothetical protein VHH73_17790 [Verrucomicrobiae bacterium]|nr:hypothetical protein [Verrucomicrobiae bacterium]
MKTTTNRYGLGAKTRLAFGLAAVAACLLAENSALAHISYSGRDLGSYSGQTNGTLTITNQTVTGNYGWADAADGVLGDSHRGRAFRFHLDKAAYVNLTVSANPHATTNSLGGFTPAFSVYSGLAAVAPFAASQTTNAPSADHDFSDASVAWRTWWVQQNLNPQATDPSPTDGSWNALGDWKIGGDGDLSGDFSQLSSFVYKGSASSTAAGGSVTGTFSLAAGDYTVFIGGNDIANKTANTALSPHGIAVSISVSASPFVDIAPKVFVSLPAGLGTNWVLEAGASAAATNWTAVTATPVTVGGQLGILLDSGAGAQFFRLRSLP